MEQEAIKQMKNFFHDAGNYFAVMETFFSVSKENLSQQEMDELRELAAESCDALRKQYNDHRDLMMATVKKIETKD